MSFLNQPTPPHFDDDSPLIFFLFIPAPILNTFTFSFLKYFFAWLKPIKIGLLVTILPSIIHDPFFIWYVGKYIGAALDAAIASTRFIFGVKKLEWITWDLFSTS